VAAGDAVSGDRGVPPSAGTAEGAHTRLTQLQC
jgi:hypothetical protein